MEMARIPVRAFGSEEFFHGPRFSVGPKDAVWIPSEKLEPSVPGSLTAVPDSPASP